MKNEIDPVRWTQSSDDAPEFLRAPFAAAAKEGPSPAQMRMLAIKLAAIAAGSAVTASASTAHAGTTLGGGTVVASSLPLAKVVIAVALVGAALGGVALFSKPSDSSVRTPSVEQTSRAPVTPEAASQAAPVVEDFVARPAPSSPVVQAENARDAQDAAPSAQAETAAARASTARATRPVNTNGRTNAKPVVTKSAPARSEVRVSREAHDSTNKADVPSEVELLRRARTALAARPREAFALTEQHREHYPQGVFAQERDALAIEALLRAGDTEMARKLATSFVSAHPSSPHAHRFRETLGLR